MRKTIGALALALGLAFSPGCGSKQTPQKLEQKVCEHAMFGFSLDEEGIIKNSLKLVAERYKTPNIVFYEKAYKHPINIEADCWNGMLMGLCKENKKKLPGRFDYNRFGDYHLIFLRDKMDHDRGLVEGVYSSLKPMCSTTIHEIGHIYQSLLAEKERQRLVVMFSEIDTTLVQNIPENPHPGHASFYSYRHLIDSEMSVEQTKKFYDEQFAETFVYIISNSTHQDNDLKFCMKRNAVRMVMQRFKR